MRRLLPCMPRPFQCLIRAVPSWPYARYHLIPWFTKKADNNSTRSSSTLNRPRHECRVSSQSTARSIQDLWRLSRRTHPTKPASTSRSHRDAHSSAGSIPRHLQTLRARPGSTRPTQSINESSFFKTLRIDHWLLQKKKRVYFLPSPNSQRNGHVGLGWHHDITQTFQFWLTAVHDPKWSPNFFTRDLQWSPRNYRNGTGWRLIPEDARISRMK